MIPPDKLNLFQFWAGDGQGKGRGAQAVGPPGGGRTGNAPAPGAGQGTGTAGAGPQSRSCRGPLDSPDKPGGQKSLRLSSQPSQAWCSSLQGGAFGPKHQPPPDTPSTSCRSGIFVFQFSFPRTTMCSMPSLGGGCLPPPTLLPAGLAPARWKAKGFFPQWDAPERSGRAARPRLLRVGQERYPAPRALNA